MNGNNDNLELPVPEQVVAFFVPSSVAAYVTEIIELALSDNPDVTVAAGTVTEVHHKIGRPLCTIGQDKEALPELEKQEAEKVLKRNKRTMKSRKRSQRMRYKRLKFTKNVSCHRKGKRPRSKVSSTPETENHCCANQMANKLARKYGEPIPEPNGQVSAPRLMIQYPDLPFMVPVHQKFKDLGVPRNVVDFCYNAVFVSDSNEQLPFLKSE